MLDQKYELLLIYISQIGISFMPLWPFIFTYYGSYCYAYQPNLRYIEIYLVVFFCPVGRITSQIVYPYLFQIFGTIELLMSYFAFYFTNFISGCLFLMFKGILYQGVMNCSNIFLSCKYKNGIYKSKYLMTFRSLSSYIWFVYLLWQVNPQFKSQNLTNKYGEQFFEKEISLKFGQFLKIYGITVFIILSIVGLSIENPVSFQSRVNEFWEYLQGKRQQFQFEDTNQIKQENTSSDAQSEISSILDYQDNFNIENQKSKNTLLDSQEKEDELKQIQEQNLVLKICFLFLLSMHTTIYHIDSFRYIALYLKFSDQYVSISYFLSTISAFLSTYLATYIQQQYGMKQNLKLILANQTLVLIFILLSTNFYIVSTIFMNAQIACFFVFNDIFCYSNFAPVKAMKYAKYFLITALLGNFTQSFLNYYFFDQTFYKKIYIINFIATIIGIIFYYSFLENDVLLNKNKNNSKI